MRQVHAAEDGTRFVARALGCVASMLRKSHCLTSLQTDRLTEWLGCPPACSDCVLLPCRAVECALLIGRAASAVLQHADALDRLLASPHEWPRARASSASAAQGPSFDWTAPAAATTSRHTNSNPPRGRQASSDGVVAAAEATEGALARLREVEAQALRAWAQWVAAPLAAQWLAAARSDHIVQARSACLSSVCSVCPPTTLLSPASHCAPHQHVLR